MSISRPARVYPHVAAAEERDRRGLRLDDDVDRALEQRILVGIEVLVLGVRRRFRLGDLEHRLVQILLALVPALLDDERDLLLAHVRALETLQAGGARAA